MTENIARFKIQGVGLSSALISELTSSIEVKSSPRSYRVNFPQCQKPFQWLEGVISKESHPLILADSFVLKNLLAPLNLKNAPTLEIEAVETNKDIQHVLKVCDFLIENGATKKSSLIVIGGGILQDLGAFASYLVKRGIPWHFVPTTLLAQGDSCVGGKTAVNHRNAKNVLGLFSAPRNISIDTRFVSSLTASDRFSGVGEIFRLAITGGPVAFEQFVALLPDFLRSDVESTAKMIGNSLSIKKAVVEYDEFELDVRRSMNYGHSVGHALEALTSYAVPHGIAVTFGILVENELSVARGTLSHHEARQIFDVGRRLIPENMLTVISGANPEDLLPYLQMDKKAEGRTLKLATIRSIGNMEFSDLPLDEAGVKEIGAAFLKVLKELSLK